MCGLNVVNVKITEPTGRTERGFEDGVPLCGPCGLCGLQCFIRWYLHRKTVEEELQVGAQQDLLVFFYWMRKLAY